MSFLRLILLILLVNSAQAQDFKSLQEKFQKQAGHHLFQLGSAFVIFDCHTYDANGSKMKLEQYIIRYERYYGLVLSEDLEFLPMSDFIGVYPNGAYANGEDNEGVKTFVMEAFSFRAWDENPKYLLMQYQERNQEPSSYSMCFPGMAVPEAR
ncbi:MAG: hypothetical protein JNM93_08795 [Bacteriovoracaceae bacterium]|nr:hypothetical protein [Bacteriovoracaceae bacterium]